jgi:O-antigen/teichoic acid export membrane protein
MNMTVGESLQSDLRQIGIGASLALVGRVIGRGLVVVSQIVFARLLGPRDFGLFALAWTMLQMGGLVAPLGLDKGVLRFGSRYVDEDPASLRAVIRTSLTWSLVVGSAMGLGLYASSPWIASGLFGKPDMEPIIQLISLALPLLAGLHVAAAASRISKRMEYSVIAQDLAPPVVLILGFLLLYRSGQRLNGAGYSVLAAYATAFLLALVLLRLVFPATSSPARTSEKTHLKELLTFSIATSLTGVFSMFLIWTNRLILGVYRPESEVGVYQAVSQLPLLTAIILSAFSAITTPMMASFFHSGELERLRDTYTTGTKWAVYISAPVFVVLLTLPAGILALLFGTEYAIGAKALVIITLGQTFNVASGPTGLALQMTGKHKLWLWTTATSLVMSIILSLLLAPSHGMIGTAVATAVGIAVLYLTGMLLVRHELGFFPFDRRLLKAARATILALGAGLILAKLYPPEGPVGIAVAIAGILLIYTASLVFSGLDSEDLAMLKSLTGAKKDRAND